MTEQRDNSRNRSKGPQRKRSRGNPAIDLRTARHVLSVLDSMFADRPFSRDEGAQALGYASGSSGLPARKLAALRHFGLLIRRQGTFQVSPLGRRLLSSTDLPEVRRARKEAFHSPALFIEIVSKYQKGGRLPRYFSQALVEDFDISEQARDKVAKIFLASARFADVLNQDSEFVTPQPEPQRPLSPAGPSPPQSSPPMDPVADTDVIPVLLDGQGRRAWLKMPQEIYIEDIAALKRYLDSLEPLAVEKPAGGLLPFKTRS